MGEEQQDNRNINVNMHQAQKISYEEIEQMKATGASGDAIIQNLVQNSETFNQRTKFSKEKYLRRKKQKYTFFFEARFPCIADLADCLAQHVPHTICNLRTDSVGFLLNITNINSNSKVCLVENTRGFLMGCVMEKDIQQLTRVEFAKTNSLKNDIDYYENFNHPYFKNKRITYLTQKMLLDKECPISAALTKSMHATHDSLLICHD